MNGMKFEIYAARINFGRNIKFYAQKNSKQHFSFYARKIIN